MTPFQRTMQFVEAETKLAEAFEKVKRTIDKPRSEAHLKALWKMQEARHAILRAGSERD